MIIASIDIGTNTILLLIAEITEGSKIIKTILNEYRMPRIGKGLLPGNPVSEDRISSMKVIISEYKKIIEQNKCDKVLVNATNAFRIASNRDELVAIVQSILGVKPEVINGKTEAEYAFLGSVSEYLQSGKTGGVIDIGGGSTEITLGKMDDILFSHSFPFGVVSLSEKYFKNNPPLDSEINEMKNEIKKRISFIPSGIPLSALVGVAGTPTSLSCISQNLQEYSDELVEGSKLSLKHLFEIEKYFSVETTEDLLAAYPKILPGREDLIFSGLIILKTVMEYLTVPELIVSSKGIRYGAIANYIKNI